MSKIEVTGTRIDKPIQNGEVYVTSLDKSTKLLYVKIGATSALYHIHTFTVYVVSASGIYSAVKDTASKVNVYIEDDVVKIQNNAASEADVTYITF